METNNPLPNTPSVERAYKHKCIALKKRLREIEAENDAMRTRNDRGERYIQKMRLESAMLLQRLSVLTGMAEEQGPGSSGAHSGGRAHPDENGPASEAGGNSAAGNGGTENQANDPNAYMDDDTEGSSDDHPPTPQKRPLRVKRSHKPDVVGTKETQIVNEPNKDPTSSNAHHAGSSSLPHLAPVNDTRRTSNSQQPEHLTSSFRMNNASGNSTPVSKSPQDPPVRNNQNNGVQPFGNNAPSAAPPNEAVPSDTNLMDTEGSDNHPDLETET